MFGGMSRSGLIACLIMLLAPGAASAQDSTAVPTVADAIAARDTGNLEGAAALLRRVLEREPGNGEATRHLAQLLYWLKDVAGATALYERGVRELPEDFSLQLDYARMLVETRSDKRAVEILTPLTARPETAARSWALLGTIEYWSGDFTAAAQNFRRALDADPSLDEARKPLDEIRTVSAPWTSLRVGGLHDDQPLDRLDGEVEAGAFLTPALRLVARGRFASFSTDEPGSPRISSADAGLTYSSGATPVEASFSAGAVFRSFAETGSDWIARASARVRFLPFASVEARADRTPYFATVASLSDSVMVNSVSGIFAVDHPRGWLGEAAYRVEQFNDDNSVRTAYAWMLAPIAREEKVRVSIGYGVSYQDADETRFGFRYDPYFTPENILAHSAIGSLTLMPKNGTNIVLRGGYGVNAREDVPPQPNSPGASSFATLATFTRRQFNPWDAHMSLNTSLSDAFTLAAGVDAMKTAFYQATSATVSLTYRFLPRPSR